MARAAFGDLGEVALVRVVRIRVTGLTATEIDKERGNVQHGGT